MQQLPSLLLVLAIPVLVIIVLVVALLALRKSKDHNSIPGISDKKGNIINPVIIRIFSTFFILIGAIGIVVFARRLGNSESSRFRLLAYSVAAVFCGSAGFNSIRKPKKHEH
jgi:uncharacterized membrane protein YfcA